jgi:hypothetical protein
MITAEISVPMGSEKMQIVIITQQFVICQQTQKAL